MEAEEEVTEGEILEIQRQMNERLSRLMRIRRQKRLLRDKGLAMLERNLQSIEELEVAEREEVRAVVDVQSVGAVDVIDWSSVGLVDPSLLVAETPLVSSGSG